MPVNVRDLQPGDRVVLNCPKARYKARREAEFSGIYTAAELRAFVSSGNGMILDGVLALAANTRSSY